LTIQSALACYHARNSRYPADLSSLASDCIAAFPRDPFTGEDFRYHQTPGESVVYNPGPMGQDSGTKPGSWCSVLSGKADLTVDMFDYNND